MYLLEIINGENPYDSDRSSNEYICINSCGYFVINNPSLGTERINGRSDYQLLYICKGYGFFNINGIKTKVDEGNIVIYKPFQPQIYKYYDEKVSEIFWIHFTGRGIEELLKTSNLYDKQVYFIGKCSEINTLILKIIKEIQIKSSNYELFCNAYFYELISHISRRITQLNNTETSKKFKKIIAIIEYMHNNYNDRQNIDDYSKQCNLSKYHFIHLFKQYTGFSPCAYKTKMRMEKAKELLSGTTFNISEIAEITGYDDPLYFSKLFKKNTGMSPLEYKKRLQSI